MALELFVTTGEAERSPSTSGQRAPAGKPSLWDLLGPRSARGNRTAGRPVRRHRAPTGSRGPWRRFLPPTHRAPCSERPAFIVRRSRFPSFLHLILIVLKN